MKTNDKPWKTYEEVATHLLHKISTRLGLEHVEGKQHVAGLKSGTKWEIDAKGVKPDGENFVIVEIRRYTSSRITQEDTAAIAYRIQDTGAVGGIIVSPMGLQEGAKFIATAENIISVRLNENSTTTEYILKFLNQIMLSMAPDSISASASIISGTLTTVIESTKSGAAEA
ncbi:hypothetical protein [Aquabacterium sp. OR-4]|uniref:hypothetical protein n=1 Tax=Aquabacterium sp. OR-4 TaxID=2978127 RepID=UPI0021B2D1F8|nr:hypothetical protein [Aquabacterium sp. OR-4]MDT7838438.1 hypothetical protein [Aquabacterium sp. OR-4]